MTQTSKKQKSKLLPFREFIAKSRGQEQTRTAPDHNDQTSHSSRTNPDLRRAKQKAKTHIRIIKDVVRQGRMRDLAENRKSPDAKVE
jgi:hypothetical protein